MDERSSITRRGLLAGAAAAAAAPSLAQRPRRVPASERLRLLIEESDRARRALDPLGALRQGLRPTGPAFIDPLSDSYALAARRNAERDAAGLAGIERAALGPVDRIAFDVLLYRTRRALAEHRSGRFAIRHKTPLNASSGLLLDFPDFAATTGARLDDHSAALERLRGFALYIGSVERRLREGMATGYLQPKVTAEQVLRQIDAMLAVPIEQSPLFAAGRGSARADAYRRAISNEIYPAYRRLRGFIASIYLPAATAAPGRWAMKDGLALYAADLAQHTTTDMSADQVHALGLSEVGRIRGEMERTRGRIGFAGDLPAFFEHVRSDPRFYYRESERLIAHFEEVEGRIWSAMPRLFSRRPRAGFEVRPLPSIGEQRGTGYYRAGPADGSGPGILYFNVAMLPTRPIPTIETLTLHEGIPGHHYQISLTQENEALPPILRFGQATAYSEGWGLYSESLGPELGLFQDPYQLFGRLDMEMLRAVRLVVDTGIHASRWSRQRAIDYMLANTSMAARDVAVESDRYISMPGQAAAYKVGELKIQELRRRAASRFGSRFDILAFHDQVLDTGALPLSVLESKLTGWMNGRG